MKHFFYKLRGKLKGMTALLLCMGLFSTSIFAKEPVALSAAEQGVQEAVTVVEEPQPLPTLTEEEALKKAKKHSPDLRSVQSTADFLQETKEDIWDMAGFFNPVTNYDYKQWVDPSWYAVNAAIFQTATGMEQNKYGEQITQMALEMTVKSSFISILQAQNNLELVRKNAEMQEKLYQQGKVKNELGLLSQYQLDQLEIAAEKAHDTEAQLLDSLEQLYIKLNDLMGEKTDARFTYVYDMEYQPYEMSRSMEMYLADKTKNEPSIKILELNVETAKFNQNYLSIADTGSSAQRDLDMDTANRALKTAKTNMELAIRNAYLQIGQLETAYASAQADLTKAQADYRAAQINLQAGNVTATTVEQAELGVLQAENALKELAYNHEMLIYTFEHPSLLTASSSNTSTQ